MPKLPTPADEALARQLMTIFNANEDADNLKSASEFIAAHVAAQAPSGSTELASEALCDLLERDCWWGLPATKYDDAERPIEYDTKPLCFVPVKCIRDMIDRLPARALAAHKAQPVAEAPIGEQGTIHWAREFIKGRHEPDAGIMRGWALELAKALLGLDARHADLLAQRHPVADVRGMVEALEVARADLNGLSMDTIGVDEWIREWCQKGVERVDAALASARHAMGGVKA